MVSKNFPALAAVAHGRDTLTTNEAAPAINRAPQTLRKWACLECGPIRPIRINGRLAWRVSDLMGLLSGEVANRIVATTPRPKNLKGDSPGYTRSSEFDDLPGCDYQGGQY